PGVISKLLRSAVDLPAAEGLETLVIHDEDAAGRLAVLVSEGGDVDAPGATVDGMRAGVAGLVRKLRRLDDLDDFRRPGIGFGVKNVDARGAQARDHEVSSLHMRVRRVRAQTRRAGVPTEMVELVADLGRGHVADDLGVRRRFRIDVDDGDAVRGFSVGIEGSDVGERFGRRLRRLARRGIKTWIRRPGGHVIFSSRDRRASSSSRLRRIAQADPSATESLTCKARFLRTRNRSARSARVGAPRIRGHCSSAGTRGYIKTGTPLFTRPFFGAVTILAGFRPHAAQRRGSRPGRAQTARGGAEDAPQRAGKSG